MTKPPPGSSRDAWVGYAHWLAGQLFDARAAADLHLKALEDERALVRLLKAARDELLADIAELTAEIHTLG